MESQDIDQTRPMKPSSDDASMQDTAPIQVKSEPPANTGETRPKRNRMWIVWAFLGVLAMALIAVGSAYGGYASAIQERTSYEATLFAGEAQMQYDLALQDYASKNYDRARQRLEYIIQELNPNFPGAAELLAQIRFEQGVTATATLAPTPTLTPTPDLRGRDELYSQAQAYLVAEEWTSAIDTLLLLRKRYSDFMAVQVDGMLYVALRNRGIEQISVHSNLESGTYDLALAEQFGPLDAEARNWRDWAELYIRGASFWNVNWAEAVYYFSQLAISAPNLSDASGWTATDRYLLALLGYGDWLAAHGEWCLAQEQYDTYMTLVANVQVEPTAVYAAEQCASGAGAVVSETPTPEGGGPTATPETPPPTDTPTP